MSAASVRIRIAHSPGRGGTRPRTCCWTLPDFHANLLLFVARGLTPARTFEYCLMELLYDVNSCSSHSYDRVQGRFWLKFQVPQAESQIDTVVMRGCWFRWTDLESGGRYVCPKETERQITNLFFVCPAGCFCSHFASQSLGVQGASLDPNLVLIHGSTCPMYHPMPRILQEHTWRHSWQKWAWNGGVSYYFMLFRIR